MLIAGLLFGLVHPGCKWITATGLDLLPFCLLFVVSRLLLQVPIVWRMGGARLTNWAQWKTLLALGAVGAALRLTEFLGIVEGLPVSLVSFLVYLHPVWTIVFSRYLNGEPIQGLKVFKIGAALVGTALLCNLTSLQQPGQLLQLWSPIAAGVFISLWICLSNRAQKQGVSIVSVSFYYDLFTLVPLLLLIPVQLTGEHWMHTWEWLSQPRHLMMMAGYSILTGLLPNYAFYGGVRRSTALAAALLMLFEPIASSLIAVWAWNEPISSSFYWGAILILMINLPDPLFLNFFRRFRLPTSGGRVSLGRTTFPDRQ